jgi:hypothetical protein
MVADSKWSEKLRCKLHTLDLKNSENEILYKKYLREFISFNELDVIGEDEFGNPKFKIKKLAYDDGKENFTIGFGFNMDDKTAEDQWEAAFKEHPISFDDVQNHVSQ